MEKPSQNGHHPDDAREHISVNPYIDAMRADQPRELTEFQLNTDPYANMIPRVESLTLEDEAEALEPGSRRRSPLVVAISVLLIVVLVLPVMAEVFMRLTH